VVARHDGLIVSHMRDEQDHIFEALEEMIEIGRQSGARIHISHLKCMGKNNWGKMPLVLERIENARDNGVIISFDQYPYEASSTTLSLLLPPWAQEGGYAGFEKALTREGAQNEILIEIEKTIERRGGAESIRIASAPAEEAAPVAGRSLAEAAEMWGVSPSKAAFRILQATRLGTTAIYHAMSLEDVERAMGHDLHTVGSDGVLVGDSPHPRATGTFPRVIHHFRKDRGLFTLEAAIHDMTAKSAQVMKLPGRGLVRAGYHADLIVFDPDEFQDHATYDNPRRLPTGLEWVFINGRPVVEGGEMRKVRSGRVLRPNDPM
jgi:N-acyl-D-amino-acid deacylase